MAETAAIDFVLMANHVEVVNGLLYVSGGGWTDHHRRLPPDGSPIPPSHLGIGVSVVVPWNETNRSHTLIVQIEDEDAQALIRIEGQLNVGRPATLPAGAIQPVFFGFPLDIPFPHAGGYRVVARVGEDGEPKMWPFRVHDLPARTVA
jgi:uncharacterized protein DUF6941